MPSLEFLQEALVVLTRLKREIFSKSGIFIKSKHNNDLTILSSKYK